MHCFASKGLTSFSKNSIDLGSGFRSSTAEADNGAIARNANTSQKARHLQAPAAAAVLINILGRVVLQLWGKASRQDRKIGPTPLKRPRFEPAMFWASLNSYLP